MNKARADGRSKGEARHLRLYHWMLDSPAWRSLSLTERGVYLTIAARYTGNNNGRIPCSVREIAEETQTGKSTVHRALEGLIDRGFLDREMRGHLSREKVASQWRLTEHKCDVTGALASRDFMRWRPAQNP